MQKEVCVESVDFNAALHHVRPSVQRGSDIFLDSMPRKSWDDIGGLDDVKDKLKQVSAGVGGSELYQIEIHLSRNDHVIESHHYAVQVHIISNMVT